jgi:competence protein ComEC
MRILIILAVIFFQLTASSLAASNNAKNIEGINLNLKDHEMAVTFFGLSDGEVTLIQGPNGKNILVNVGGKDTLSDLKELLSLYKVQQIHSIIMTKSDNPTFNSINQIISSYNVKEIFTTPQSLTQLNSSLSIGNEVEIAAWDVGMKSELFPDLSIEVLFSGDGENEGLDFTLNFFKHRIFLMNSSSHRAEEILLNNKNLDNINIFKIPNWAKEDSLSERFIQYINPQISILFASENHQPDPDIINDLQDTWSEILFTKKHGTISVKFTEANYEVFTFKKEKSN